MGMILYQLDGCDGILALCLCVCALAITALRSNDKSQPQ